MEGLGLAGEPSLVEVEAEAEPELGAGNEPGVEDEAPSLAEQLRPVERAQPAEEARRVWYP